MLFSIKQRNSTHLPKKVKAQEYPLLTRIRARLGRVKLIDDHFLSYCKHHKTYFVDNEHTNGNIRCPACDQDWLIRHHMTSIPAAL